MIDVAAVIPTVVARLTGTPVGHYLELKTYKKDRSIKIVKISEEELLIIEDGFSKERFQVEVRKVKKALKCLIKKEFPRSNKAHLYSGKFE